LTQDSGQRIGQLLLPASPRPVTVSDWLPTFKFGTPNVGGCRNLPFSGRGLGCPLYLRSGRSTVSRPDGDHLSPRRSASGSSHRLPAAAPDPVRSAEATSSLPRKRPLNVVSSSELARAADVERWLAECARLAVDLVVVASGPVARDVMTASPTRHPI